MRSPAPKSHSVTGLQPALQVVAELDIQAASCLSGTGLTAEQLRDQRHQVTLQQEVRFYRNVLELSGDPAIGLKIGKNFLLQRHGLFGYAMMAAPTLRQALVLATRFGDLSFTWFKVHSAIAGNVTLSFHDRLDIDEDVANLLRDRDCAAAVNGFSEMLGRALPLDRVGLPHRGHGHPERYRDFFRCPVIFESSPARIELPIDALDQQLPHHDAAALEHLHQQCQLLLSKLSTQTHFVDEVRQLLLARPGFFPDIGYVAERLGLAERSLRRRLSDENTTYSAILDEVRFGLAREYLRETRLPLQEIAALLGYTEPGNFTHAFKRWTGLPPADFRRTQTASG